MQQRHMGAVVAEEDRLVGAAFADADDADLFVDHLVGVADRAEAYQRLLHRFGKMRRRRPVGDAGGQHDEAGADFGPIQIADEHLGLVMYRLDGACSDHGAVVFGLRLHSRPEHTAFHPVRKARMVVGDRNEAQSALACIHQS
jgi:hypothetical protein